MPEPSDLDRRLRAVERALTDGDHDVAALRDAAELAERLDDVEERLDAIDERIAELEAATQAVRGYVGNVRAVNESVADRADAALAAVDRIEAHLDGGEGKRDLGGHHRTPADGSARAPTDGSAPPPGRGRSHTADGGSSDTDAGDYAVEMPAPGADDARSDGVDEEDGRGVVDRVREVL